MKIPSERIREIVRENREMDGREGDSPINYYEFAIMEYLDEQFDASQVAAQSEEKE